MVLIVAISSSSRELASKLSRSPYDDDKTAPESTESRRPSRWCGRVGRNVPSASKHRVRAEHHVLRHTVAETDMLIISVSNRHGIAPCTRLTFAFVPFQVDFRIVGFGLVETCRLVTTPQICLAVSTMGLSGFWPNAMTCCNTHQTAHHGEDPRAGLRLRQWQRGVDTMALMTAVKKRRLACET
mmetsp:Transcript_22888/g.60293  ORF Transcript_22888/g.60293 Transcript_22888/m.60293 type:complete len:184 (-) Transcript_22888:45-596(-)